MPRKKKKTPVAASEPIPTTPVKRSRTFVRVVGQDVQAAKFYDGILTEEERNLFENFSGERAILNTLTQLRVQLYRMMQDERTTRVKLAAKKERGALRIFSRTTGSGVGGANVDLTERRLPEFNAAITSLAAEIRKNEEFLAKLQAGQILVEEEEARAEARKRAGKSLDRLFKVVDVVKKTETGA